MSESSRWRTKVPHAVTTIQRVSVGLPPVNRNTIPGSGLIFQILPTKKKAMKTSESPNGELGDCSDPTFAGRLTTLNFNAKRRLDLNNPHSLSGITEERVGLLSFHTISSLSWIRP